MLGTCCCWLDVWKGPEYEDIGAKTKDEGSYQLR